MNEIVKYKNDLNNLLLPGFSDVELRLFFTICAKIRDRGSEDIELSLTEIRKLAGTKRNYTYKEYEGIVTEMFSKLLHTSFYYDNKKTGDEHVRGETNIFTHWELIGEDTIRVNVTPKFEYLFNQLESEFTRFELLEYVQLAGKYPKNLYRQLKQWRTVGRLKLKIEKLYALLDVPDTYQIKELTRRVLNPSVEKLNKLKSFSTLKYEYIRGGKGNQVKAVEFTWTPENPRLDAAIKKNLEKQEKPFRMSDYPEKRQDYIGSMQEAMDYAVLQQKMYFPELETDETPVETVPVVPKEGETYTEAIKRVMKELKKG